MGRKKNKESEAKIKKRREQKKLSMQRSRQKMLENPTLHEEAKKKERERYYQRKALGKIKTIESMNDREKRVIRKIWKHKAKKYRNDKKKHETILNHAVECTPPTSPCQDNSNDEVIRSGIERGKRMIRRNREKTKKKIKELEENNKKLKTQLEKYKKRLSRMSNKNKSQDESPRKKVSRLLKSKDKISKHALYKKVLFAEVMTKQIHDNYGKYKSPKQKRLLASALAGNFIKKYRCMTYLQTITSRKVLGKDEHIKNKIVRRRFYVNEKVKTHITNFLETDRASRLCSGKKETITRKKKKKQKRYLNDTLKNLLTDFKEQYTQYQNLSYQTFCRLRPFWITYPKASDRETCLCKTHENMILLTRKLSTLNLINENYPNDMLQTMCCNRTNESCLERNCSKCKFQQVVINAFEDSPVQYKKWAIKKVPTLIRGKVKMISKTVKLEIDTTKKKLVEYFFKEIPTFMNHVSNIIHQYKETSNIKSRLSQNEVLIHIDFSENYSCKYFREIQSAHFGGSKSQVTIHTCVMYCHKDISKNPISFGTFSSCNRHDPAAIIAHIMSISEDIRKLVPNLTKLHFLSDGPATQYKNRKMFQMLGGYLPKKLNIEELHWHFSESAHGKGAPDGVGAVLKRTADHLVSHQEDIPDCDTLVNLLQKHIKSVIVKKVDESEITAVDTKIPNDTHVFKGTMKIHEVVFRSGSHFLEVRRLTCNDCSGTCRHYLLGHIPLSTMYLAEKPAKRRLFPNDYNSSDCDSDLESVDGVLPKRLAYSQIYSSESESDTTENKSCRFKCNDYLIVKVYGKKSVKKYIGNVTECLLDNEYKVRFMLRCPETKNKFVFSNEPEAIIRFEDVDKVLNQPSLNHRLQYCFNDIPNALLI